MGRILHASRRVVILALLGMLAFVTSGCGDEGSKPATGAAGEAAEKQHQVDERAAREKAFGAGGNTTEAPKK